MQSFCFFIEMNKLMISENLLIWKFLKIKDLQSLKIEKLWKTL